MQQPFAPLTVVFEPDAPKDDVNAVQAGFSAFNQQKTLTEPTQSGAPT